MFAQVHLPLLAFASLGTDPLNLQTRAFKGTAYSIFIVRVSAQLLSLRQHRLRLAELELLRQLSFVGQLV